MTTSSPQRRHLASSPFKAEVEPVIEQFEVGDLVTHDAYGMGRVINVETGAVTVDFRPQVIRIPSPFARLSGL